MQSVKLTLLICFLSLLATSQQADILQSQIDEYHTYLSKIHGYDVTRGPKTNRWGQKINHNLFKLFKRKVKECTQAGDFKDDEHKEYLEAFAKGGCSPIILIPGITGSKLVAKIDCEVLKEKSPEVFEACGWNTCEYLGRKDSVPLSEYLIWLPGILSPMSLTKPADGPRRCLEGVLGFKITKVEQGGEEKLKFDSTEGVEVKVLGDTDDSGTMKASQCAMDAVQNLALTPYQPAIGQAYSGLILELEKVGYKIGLTMQALPFDWRKKIGDDDSRLRLRKILKEMYEMTGKKVTVVSHSLGSYYALDLFWSLNQADKDRMVARWIALAPPLAGAVRANEAYIGKLSKN